jgi:hypothetical protein
MGAYLSRPILLQLTSYQDCVPLATIGAGARGDDELESKEGGE